MTITSKRTFGVHRAISEMRDRVETFVRLARQNRAEAYQRQHSIGGIDGHLDGARCLARGAALAYRGCARALYDAMQRACGSVGHDFDIDHDRETYEHLVTACNLCGERIDARACDCDRDTVCRCADGDCKC